ncbi:MAG: type II toxin-antitoxin system VapC family toxin [Candidatus Levybacteria bacterium]|nr:type II toxin-antitoxin system VapC family toxin [Candidatus Levybacteria bacterium]
MTVVDASVVYKWFDQKEPSFEQAIALLETHIQGKTILLAPDILIYELTNAWTTKTAITVQGAKTNLLKFQELGVELQPYTFPFMQKVMMFAQKYHVTMYAASYAVLAQEKKCTLITADAKFVRQVNKPFVKLLY